MGEMDPHRQFRFALMLTALVVLPGCGGGGGGGDGDGSDGGGGMPSAGPPTVILSSLSACGGEAVDRWTFETLRGRDITFQVDTLDSANTGDMCMRGRCGAVDIGGDDEVPCTAVGAGFACPLTRINTRRAGACTVDVTTCSSSCVNPTEVGYELTVDSSDGGPELTQVNDDVEAGVLSKICFDGASDSALCTSDAQCDPGTCMAVPLGPRPGTGDPLEGVDVPSGATGSCSVSVTMTSEITYASLKYKIDYGETDGGFPGVGSQVSCERNAGGSAVFNDFDASKVLLFRQLSGNGVTGPQRLSSCTFMHSLDVLTPAAFSIAVTDALDPDGNAITPELEVGVNCSATSSTTMLSPTSTTMPLAATTTTTTPEPTVSTTMGSGGTIPTSTTTSTTLIDVACGDFVTEWGSLGNTDGRFNHPVALAVNEGADRVYVVDRNNSRIQQFNGSGDFVSTWGSAGSTNGRFSGPSDIAIDGAGNVYVADTKNHRVQKFDASGDFLLAWGSSGDGNGEFNLPVGVAVSDGEVYVVDGGNDRVQVFDTTGNYLRQFGEPGTSAGRFNEPRGIDAIGGGNVFVADAGRDRVLVFSPIGSLVMELGASGKGPGQFSAPHDVATRGDGDIFVVDTGGSRIQQFRSDGLFVAEWNGTSSGQTSLNMPQGADVRGNADIFVADTRNHRIRVFRCH